MRMRLLAIATAAVVWLAFLSWTIQALSGLQGAY